MKPKVFIAISLLLFALLMSLPFMAPGCGFVALFALVPLLLADYAATSNSVKGFWWMQSLAFLLFNFITIFWIRNATLGGAIFAVVANAAQMALVFEAFRFSKRWFKGVLPYVFLMLLWLAFESHYYDVEISFPWLNFGNAFARSIKLVQWYEYTGSMGGSLWIWLANYAVFGGIVALVSGAASKWNIKAKIAYWIALTGVFALPICVSMFLWTRGGAQLLGSEDGVSDEWVDVVIGQPNFDPYQKFESYSRMKQNQIFWSMVEPAVSAADSSKNILLLSPETFCTLTLNDFDDDITVRYFRRMLAPYPNVSMLLGAATYEIHENPADRSPWARQMRSGLWYDAHNSAIMLAPETFDVYHKSRLVVGTEYTPFPSFFVPIDDRLGGVMGRDAGQKEASVFDFDGHKFGCAICYESIYGEYCTEFVKKGAEFLTVITNDAWWGNTAGYRQHLSYSSLRAIETRRSIARCANTGISAIISERGEILQSTPWWEEAVLAGKVRCSSKETFFVQHGDIIGRVSRFAMLLLALSLLVRIVTSKDRKA